MWLREKEGKERERRCFSKKYKKIVTGSVGEFTKKSALTFIVQLNEHEHITPDLIDLNQFNSLPTSMIISTRHLIK